MPTTRHRYMVTETDEVSDALEAAARAWPHARNSRSRLIHLLIEEGYRSVSARAEQDRIARLAALERCAGAFTGVFGPSYLRDLREEWPA